MIRFLSLFPQFRTLRRRLKAALRRISALENENHGLSEQLQASEAVRADLMDRLDAARVSEITSTQRITDYFARRHGSPVFGFASEVPERDFTQMKPIERTRQQASALVEDAERQFREQLAHFRNAQTENAQNGAAATHLNG